jgi:hypothetical protein
MLVKWFKSLRWFKGLNCCAGFNFQLTFKPLNLKPSSPTTSSHSHKAILIFGHR